MMNHIMYNIMEVDVDMYFNNVQYKTTDAIINADKIKQYIITNIYNIDNINEVLVPCIAKEFNLSETFFDKDKFTICGKLTSRLNVQDMYHRINNAFKSYLLNDPNSIKRMEKIYNAPIDSINFMYICNICEFSNGIIYISL